MKLEGKKSLAARTLGVGKNRILFNHARLSEIKEAITKQDIKDLVAGGAISVKQVKGRKSVEKTKTRRRAGSIKNRARDKKREYIIITRKLRKHLSVLKNQEKITLEEFKLFRREIRARTFRSLAHLKERISQHKEQA